MVVGRRTIATTVPGPMSSVAQPPLPVMRRHPVLAVVAAWSAVACVLAAQTQLQLLLGGQSREFLPLLGVSLVGCAPWVLYTPAIVWLTRRGREARRRRGWVTALALQATWGLSIAAADGAIWACVAPVLDGRDVPWGPRFASTLLLNLFLYVSLVLFTEAADHAALADARTREAEAEALRARTLQSQLEQARLHALEAQLRPHFLHNTLNMIAELVHEAPERADSMLTQLGMLLRRGLEPGPMIDALRHEATGAHPEDASAGQLVPLAEELQFVRAYGALLGGRFGERVHLSIDVPDDVADAQVPAYLLQPIVENAFEHGARRREAPTTIRLCARQDDTILWLFVRDAPVGGHERVPAVPAVHGATKGAAVGPRQTGRRGVGLHITRERLRALYGAAAGLSLTPDGEVTTVAVWLPLRRGDAR